MATVEGSVKLEPGEKKFKQIENYTMKAYHFDRKIIYLDIANFTADTSDGNHFKLSDDETFFVRLKLGRPSKPLSRKVELWLARAILDKNYFWKNPMPPSSLYGFTTLRFMEAGDNRFKAVTELKDIHDILGKIDTMAEWRLWLLATDYHAGYAYGYKKVGKLHRIRFLGVNPFTCKFIEYFNFYDDNGTLIRSKNIKSHRQKGCQEVVI